MFNVSHWSTWEGLLALGLVLCLVTGCAFALIALRGPGRDGHRDGRRAAVALLAVVVLLGLSPADVLGVSPPIHPVAPPNPPGGTSGTSIVLVPPIAPPQPTATQAPAPPSSLPTSTPTPKTVPETGGSAAPTPPPPTATPVPPTPTPRPPTPTPNPYPDVVRTWSGTLYCSCGGNYWINITVDAELSNGGISGWVDSSYIPYSPWRFDARYSYVTTDGKIAIAACYNTNCSTFIDLAGVLSSNRASIQGLYENSEGIKGTWGAH